MKKTTRFLSLLMALVLCLSLFPAFTTEAEAATTTINSFGSGTTLTTDQFNALRNGRISAFKMNGAWYYRFVSGNTTLQVRANAFTSGVGNNYSKVDPVLTAGVMTTSGIPNITNYIYKARTGTASLKAQWTPKQGTLRKTQTVTRKTYNTLFANLTIAASRVGTEIDLQCTETAFVSFIFSDRVNTNTKEGTGYHTLKTANDYVSALTRNTSNATGITPYFTVTVSKPGSNLVCLNSVIYRGKGVADTKKEITQYVDVAVTTAKLLASTSPGSALKSLYSLYKQGVKLKTSSKEYASNAKTFLSWTKNRTTYACLRSSLTSPIKLKANGDYFRSEIRLNKALSTNGTKTQLAVNFSVK